MTRTLRALAAAPTSAVGDDASGRCRHAGAAPRRSVAPTQGRCRSSASSREILRIGTGYVGTL